LTLECRQAVHAPAIFSLLRLGPPDGAVGAGADMLVQQGVSDGV